jgi:hypothetical protein
MKVAIFARLTGNCHWSSCIRLRASPYHTLIWPLNRFGRIRSQQKIVTPVTFNYLFSYAYITVIQQLAALET